MKEQPTERQVKDRVLEQVCRLVPRWITPDSLTLAGFFLGLLIPVCSSQGAHRAALCVWLANRMLDGLDGTLARTRAATTHWGGYLDILCDFTVRIRPDKR